MNEPMSPENRSAPGELFRELETQLAALRAAAKALREERPSWADNIFHPGRRARQEADFGAAVVTALKEIGRAVQKALAQQESRIAELEDQISELKARHREELEELARKQTDTANRTTELREQVGRDHAAKVEQLASEFRERIQQVLDEQRVSIRQLALKASEDAVLSDRARRASELKLEDLAKRLPPAPPA
jgi:predicted  nucleic acid-binding Zn-ribbon protein